MYEVSQESPRYARRDAAFVKYLTEECPDVSVDSQTGYDLNQAFNAGWKARKEVDFKDWEMAGATIRRFIPADAGIKEHIVIEMPENA